MFPQTSVCSAQLTEPGPPAEVPGLAGQPLAPELVGGGWSPNGALLADDAPREWTGALEGRVLGLPLSLPPAPHTGLASLCNTDCPQGPSLPGLYS